MHAEVSCNLPCFSIKRHIRNRNPCRHGEAVRDSEPGWKIHAGWHGFNKLAIGISEDSFGRKPAVGVPQASSGHSIKGRS